MLTLRPIRVMNIIYGHKSLEKSGIWGFKLLWQPFNNVWDLNSYYRYDDLIVIIR